MEACAFDIELVPYSSGYKEQVIALWERSFKRLRPFLERDLDRLEEIGGDILILAVEAGTVVGTVIAASDGYRGWIYYLAVQHSRRRQGIARMLMDEGEARLRKIGCRWMSLQVRQRNREVVGFYARQGFRLDNSITLVKNLDRPG